MTEPETFVGEDVESSAGVLAALRKAEDAFREWQATCDDIDDAYGLEGRSAVTDTSSVGWTDTQLDMFWASYEILKPAVYARPPQPVVAPLFKDSKRLPSVTAELLERCAVSVFKRTDIDSTMIQCRDDVIFTGRGVLWLRYESEDGEQKVCIEHKDRRDFLHEPARYWSEVGWVAGASWLTHDQMKDRFGSDKADDATYSIKREDEADRHVRRAVQAKCKVWEVWHRADKKVYWVTEGVDTFLDKDEPHLDLTGFFPCPKPAYATLQRRQLIPIPDYQRYEQHFDKISDLTGRIYLLLDKVRMKGLIPAGGDVGDAVEELIKSDDDQMLIPVPGAAMLAGAATGFVAWLPLTELATAIQGLIAARTQLVQDFYELSGISDIMRGATEADETLGAQQLKSQYGSVRVREKSNELQRVAADAVKIAAEIIADKFSRETMLQMSQMELPTAADIKKRVKEIEDSAKGELKALGDKAQEAAQQSQEQVDPAQAQQALQQAQQAILAKYAPMLAEAEALVPIDEVEKLLHDERARSFTFEIESSSTILTDEMQDKQSLNEFMQILSGSLVQLSQLMTLGEPAIELWGAGLKRQSAAYRPGRTFEAAVEKFIDAAPEMAAKMAAQQGEQGDEGLAEANKALAEAEGLKAQAAMEGVKARSAEQQAENQRKIAELMGNQQSAERKHQLEVAKLQQAAEKMQQDSQKAYGDLDAKAKLQEAQINKLTADTAAVLHSIGLNERKQALSEYTAQSADQARQVDQAMSAENSNADREFRERGEGRADRQQEFTEKTAMTEGADNGA